MRMRAGWTETGGRMLSSRWGRGLLAVLVGALPAFTFPEPSLWWLAYGALVPWMLLVRTAPRPRRAALDGWLGGLGFMLAVHHWLFPNLHVFTVVLAALLGLLWAPWGWLVHRLLEGVPSAPRAVAALALVPSGWLTVELVRSWEGLGGPWGLLGASQWQVAPALRVASLGGVWLVTLLVVGVNVALVLLLTAGPWRRRAVEEAGAGAVAGTVAAPGAGASRGVGAAPGPSAPPGTVRPVAVAVAALAAGAAGVGAVWLWAPPPEPTGRLRVAVVQPGVLGGPEGAELRFTRGEELTRSLAGRDVDLVVWGESSVGADLTARPDLTARLAALSREVGAEILVNVDARRADQPGIYKSSILVGPDGPTGERYDKMRLVPFGEYVPARSLLGWATSVGEAAEEDRRRGARQVVMTTGTETAADARLGPLVCFETAFPDMSRRLVRDGAQVLVAQSATSTFQQSWAPEQHASLAALRAAESGRPFVHATLTGVSAVYGPDGARIGVPLGTDRSAAEVYEVPLATAETVYVRLGDWPVWAALALLAGAAALSGVRALTGGPRLRRRPPAPGTPVRRARTAHGSAGRHGR
ncbi:apolipoprotein N-acyltransferase [Streptomyces sp. MUM 203J]|uniref:apolipoprotein N-acyltransferase n=1 Tax=Streptomyces sp. MUM 203J TaxID=2791990 RepID=UPI001F04B41F|nr:apolipoprotein N-acyltransferase [Streptomyces sp. MUM 203J]MCH0540987.1 apolipoprotein N-acyltransferase [Streptomyces sp. MUM 203J]